jgi:hypothetical protein
MRPMMIVAFSLLTFPAFGSGNIPIPEATEKFAGQSECKQNLINMRRVHEKTVTPDRALPSKIGKVTIFRELKTDGILDAADGTVRYDYTLWTHASAWDDTTKKYTISHTFTRRAQICKDGILTVSGANGFTQPTFADKPLTAKSQQ